MSDDLSESEECPTPRGPTTPMLVVAIGSGVLFVAAILVITVALWPAASQPQPSQPQQAQQPAQERDWGDELMRAKARRQAQEDAEDARRLMMLAGAFLVGLLFCAIPGAVAFFRKHPNRIAILAMGLLLGWSFVGWALAMVWSLTDKGERLHVHHYHSGR